MKNRWYLPFALEGILAAAVFWNFPGDRTVFTALVWPLELLGRGLRWLSLAGTVGNLIAWALYLALSLSPLCLLGVKLARRTAKKEDVLLPVLGAVLAWGLYYLINPTRLPGIWGGSDMGVYLCGQVIWSAVLCWGLFALLGAGNPEKLLGWLLNALGAVLVLSAWGLELGRLLQKIQAVRQANTVGSLALTNGFLILRWAVNLLCSALSLWVIGAGRELVKGLCRDAYSQASLDAAGELIRRGTLALKTLVLSGLGLNLLQILAGEHLRDTALNLSFPLLSTVLILAGILLCRLLTRGKALQEDSDLII